MKTLASPGERGRRTERWPLRRGAAASLLLHLVVLGLIIGLWRWQRPPEQAIPVVAVIFEGTGASGVSGGGHNGGRPEATPGETSSTQAEPGEATADAAVPSAAEAARENAASAAAEPAPSDAAATPSSAIPETTQEAPQPPVAETAAPAAIPPPPTLTPPHPTHKPALRAARAAPPPPLSAESAPRLRPPTSAAGAVASVEPGTPGTGAGAGGEAGLGRGDAGLGRAALGDGDPATLGDEYLERLRRWVNRYKRYPKAALDRKEEGQVMLGFTLARDGTVLDAWVERSSGSASLDEAAVEMMRNASPVPPVPDSYRGTRLGLAMPVNYSIGFFERLFR